MVSAFNFSLTIAVICALVGSRSASLLSKPFVDLATVPIENNISPIGPTQMQIRNTFHNLIGTLEWTFRRLQEIQIASNTSAMGIALLAPWAMDLVLRVEVFMIADGSHYAFPRSLEFEDDRVYKIMAVAMSKLFRNLGTMKRADKLITEAAGEMIDKFGVSEPFEANEEVTEEYLRTFLYKYFQTLNRLFTGDSIVRVKYKKHLAEAVEFVKQNPKVQDPIFYITSTEPKELPSFPEIESFLQDKVVFRQSFANKLFLKQSAEVFMTIFSQIKEKRFLVASALIQKAALKGTRAARINDIYQQALAKAGEVPVNTSSNVIVMTLFDAIEVGLERKPKLWMEIQVLMKEIEEKIETVQKLDMLHRDSLLL